MKGCCFLFLYFYFLFSFVGESYKVEGGYGRLGSEWDWSAWHEFPK